MVNRYTIITGDLNRGRLRVILTSGQAVVFYGLASHSKDGDWFIREDQEAVDFVLEYLESKGAFYRIGAPLALPWLAGGWSSHFEFVEGGARVRTDFVSRPPRLSADELRHLWSLAEQSDFPVVTPSSLAKIKKTRREKDYPVIGELARIIVDPLEQLLESRSAIDILRLKMEEPVAWERAVQLRPVLNAAEAGQDELEVALDAERRSLMKLDDARIRGYADAGKEWEAIWHDLSEEAKKLPLRQAHAMILEEAQRILPAQVLS